MADVSEPRLKDGTPIFKRPDLDQLPQPSDVERIDLLMQEDAMTQPLFPPPETVLEEAARLTADLSGERRREYGPPLREAEDIAAMMRAITGMPFEPKHFHLVMICLKLHREGHKQKRDNRVDICGWTKVYDDYVREAAAEEERARKAVSDYVHFNQDDIDRYP